MATSKIAESGVSSSSVKASASRPKQTGALALLPTEILIQIGQSIKNTDSKDDSRDLRSLALSSASLFDSIRPLFYQSDSFSCFTHALLATDIAMMERCYEYGRMFLLPDHDVGGRFVRNIPGRKCDCKPTNFRCSCSPSFFSRPCICGPFAPHEKHRPIDDLLYDLVKNGWKSQHSETLAWLHQKGFELTGAPTSHLTPGYRKVTEYFYKDTHIPARSTHSMPELLVNLFQRGTMSRHQAVGICEMIRFLSDVGLSLPLHIYAYLSPGYVDKVPEDELGFYGPWSHFTMELALRSHCPPLLLEVLLQDYARRGYSLTSIVEEDGELTPLCRIRDGTHTKDDVRCRETAIDKLLEMLYSDLMDPTGWQEEYSGEVADIWEQKIKLLNRFHALERPENDLLLAILQSLRTIGRMPPVSCHNDKAARWSTLCESVKPFLKIPALQAHGSSVNEPDDPDMARRSHRFVIERVGREPWNPWSEWYMTRLYEQKWHEWCLENDCNAEAFEMYLRKRQDAAFDWQCQAMRAYSSSLPPWYEVDYLLWVAAVESLPLDQD